MPHEPQIYEFNTEDVPQSLLIFYALKALALIPIILFLIDIRNKNFGDTTDYIDYIHWIEGYSIGQILIYSMFVLEWTIVFFLNSLIRINAVEIINIHRMQFMFVMIFFITFILSTIHDFVYLIMSYPLFIPDRCSDFDDEDKHDGCKVILDYITENFCMAISIAISLLVFQETYHYIKDKMKTL